MSDCLHENRAEYGSFAVCFDCGAERGAASAPDLAPSIREQRLAQISEKVFGAPRDASPSGVRCPVCDLPVSSLHALTSHAAAVHMTAPVAVNA